MRYRELEGWPSSLAAVRYLWPEVPARGWEKLGDIDAPAHLHYLGGTGELMVAAWEHKIVTKTRPRQ